jgi:hypothetical protein
MSNDKSLPTRNNSGTKNSLQNGGTSSTNLLDLAMSNLSEEEIKAIRGKALDERLRLEVEALERHGKYEEARNLVQDHIDAFTMLEKGNGKLRSTKIQSNIETGSGTMRIETKSGATCFVASAAYDDPNHPDVMFLRRFRDTVLNRHAAGRTFIRAYWVVGPVLAKLVAQLPLLRHLSRQIISIIVSVLERRTRE